MTEPRIGIGIIAYYGFEDTMECLRSIVQNTTIPYEIVIHDNTDPPNKTTSQIAGCFESVHVIDSENVGCAISRNRVTDWFLERYPEMTHIVIMDQDIRVLEWWLEDMLELAASKNNAGMVSWPQLNMGGLPVRADGCVGMMPSACALYSLRAIQECGGWDETFFMYRFDSLFGQRLNQCGWRTYLVMKYYDPNKKWEQQTGGVVHDHPHQGIRRNPKWRQLQQESVRYYEGLKKREGWTEWDPLKQPRSEWDISPFGVISPVRKVAGAQ